MSRTQGLLPIAQLAQDVRGYRWTFLVPKHATCSGCTLWHSARSVMVVPCGGGACLQLKLTRTPGPRLTLQVLGPLCAAVWLRVVSGDATVERTSGARGSGDWGLSVNPRTPTVVLASAWPFSMWTSESPPSLPLQLTATTCQRIGGERHIPAAGTALARGLTAGLPSTVFECTTHPPCKHCLSAAAASVVMLCDLCFPHLGYMLSASSEPPQNRRYISC